MFFNYYSSFFYMFYSMFFNYYSSFFYMFYSIFFNTYSSFFNTYSSFFNMSANIFFKPFPFRLSIRVGLSANLTIGFHRNECANR